MRFFLLTTALLLGTAAASGKSCTAVTPNKCTDTDSCLKCGNASAYDCEACCPGCKQVTAGAYKYCSCGTGPAPPTPANERYVKANLTWNGKVRKYAMHVPNTPPTGLIVALAPVSAKLLDMWCQGGGVGNVTATTKAIVVCPAAQVLGPNKGNGSGPCWKAFQNYGYCQNAPGGGMVPEDSEDVDFIAALIEHLQDVYSFPKGTVIVPGHSNGGSMAFRFYCERSELIGGLVIQSQAYFDPVVGYYDYVNNHVPTGTPQCHPTFKRPFYSDIGTVDVYYGPNVATPGFQGIDKWRSNFSTAVLGCTGKAVKTANGPHTLPGYNGTNPKGGGGVEELETTCYEFPADSCPGMTPPGINRFCSVQGLGHDETPLSVLLPRAFTEFFPAGRW